MREKESVSAPCWLVCGGPCRAELHASPVDIPAATTRPPSCLELRRQSSEPIGTHTYTAVLCRGPQSVL